VRRSLRDLQHDADVRHRNLESLERDVAAAVTRYRRAPSWRNHCIIADRVQALLRSQGGTA
jgi:hypothetical protein